MTRHHSVTDFLFAPVPESLLYDPTISDKAVRVWGALARHGMDPSSCYPSHPRLGELLGCAARSVQRPLRDLERAGWIERCPRHGEDGARLSDGFVVHTRSAQERAPTTLFSADPPARTPRAQERDKREEEKESKKEPSANATEARALATRAWERMTPKPATPFIAAVKIAEKLLNAGHPPQLVENGLVSVPTISVGWVEGWINKQHQAAPVSANDRPQNKISRDGPEGVMQL